MGLTDAKHKRLTKLAADGITQAMVQQGLTEQPVGGFRKKLLFETLLLKPLFAGLFTFVRLIDDNRRQAGEIVRLNNRLTKVVEKWDGEGMPTARLEAVV